MHVLVYLSSRAIPTARRPHSRNVMPDLVVFSKRYFAAHSCGYCEAGAAR